MTNLDHNELNSHTNLYNFICTVKSGLHKVAAIPAKRVELAAFLVLDMMLCMSVYKPVYHFAGGAILFPAAFVYFVLLVLYLAIVGYVPGALGMLHNFSRVGFTNAVGEAPYLICREQRANGVIALTYYGTGFPLSLWIDNQLQIESALNLLIASVHDGADRRTILLECVLPNHAFDAIRWDNSLTHIADDNLLVLGRGLTGDIVVDLNKTPHILIGGNTGSGKTVLLRCLLWQAIHQGDIVYIADFKGGVDFGRVWHTLTDIITEENALLVLLARLIDELEERKKLLVAAEAANITEYGAKTGNHLPRIILCVDEAAEVLDKTNASKERKEFVSQVADKLSTLTRQGRAMGIHVWIGVQRGDADVLPGQVKNNLNIRVCGRADATLSTITIGDGRAAEQIPSDAQGRFITADGEVFQAYYFDDSLV